MFFRALSFVRSQCRAVYLVGEHSTAFMYAVCEFTDMHLFLIAASVVLLIGIAMVLGDRLLTFFEI